MRVTNLVKTIAQQLGVVAKGARAAAAGAAILVGGMAFVGDADGATLLSEGFEAGDGGTWGGGSDTFGTYDTGQDFSTSPHSGVPSGGLVYGALIGGQGASSQLLTSAPINLAGGDTTIDFDGWLSSYTPQTDHTVFEAEFFDGLDGTGSSLGTVVLADGSLITAGDGVTESVDAAGVIVAGDAGATASNWKHYVTSNAIPGGAQSVTLIYRGTGNDAYAENILITTSSVPEPGSIALLSAGLLMTIGLVRRRRKQT